MPGPTFGKGVDHRYGGDVCAGCFHTQSEEHPREDVWTGGQFHAGFRRGKEGCVPWQRCYFHLCQNAQAYARKI